MAERKFNFLYTVPSSAIDGICGMTPFSFMCLAQDLASYHYGTGGLSIPHLQKRGMTWVLIKQHFEIDEYPLWLDELTLSTWAKTPSGLLCPRNFSYSYVPGGKKASIDAALGISDRQIPQRETPFARGVTTWMVLDMNTGKPVKPVPALFGTLPFCEEDALPPVFPRFAFPVGVQDIKQMPFSPVITDIDMNDHVNNLNYVRWILSFMPEHIYAARRISVLDTYFIASAKLGDNLVCKTAVLADNAGTELAVNIPIECVHSIIRVTDGAELFRARTIWKNTAEMCRELQVE
ncbi:MAG: hypothetical protein LBS97_01770 [Treponema sp.]|jgi:acyl-ACP thioesterase|nr:hypothetical protein [Treponema sp.]